MSTVPRPRRLPPLKALRALEAAVRTGSLTGAAGELSITHSAVSQQIKTLEAHFGQALLVRGPRGVEPTAPARQFCEEMRASLDRIALAAEQLGQSGAVRTLRINAMPSIAMRWLIPRLSSFQIANPRIEVRVVTSVEPFGELKDPFDLIIRRSAMAKSGFDCARFLDDLSGPVASPAYLRRHAVKQPEDCLKHTLLHLGSRLDAWQRWFGVAKVRAPRHLDGPVFDHFFLSLQAASANLGIAIGSLALLEDDLAERRLVALFPQTVVRDAGYFALYRAPQRRDAALDLFVAWLRDQGAGFRPPGAQ
jgi:LysR family glycine cleavage system transcriptional activator